MSQLTKVSRDNVVSFDYDSLDPNIRESVRSEARQVRALLERTAASLIAIGRHLGSVRDRLTPTLFQRWVWAEFDFSPSTADKWIRVARRFADLPAPTAQKFQPWALQLLANDKAPPKAVNEAMARAKAGEPITAGKVRDLIHRHSPPSERKLNPTDKHRIGDYVNKLTTEKAETEIPHVADELERHAERLRRKAGSNGQAEDNGQANGQPAETPARQVYTLCMMTTRELSGRDLRAIRTFVENQLRDELDDAALQVEEITAEAELA